MYHVVCWKMRRFPIILQELKLYEKKILLYIVIGTKSAQQYCYASEYHGIGRIYPGFFYLCSYAKGIVNATHF